MGNIVLLDELTINKIAAGEVIERPASVIKEMIENSIDAGATNITVEIKNGGISYIRITDDGNGMEKDDLEIAFERHATSKIRSADDLNIVKSMGFRGEALASIAAIANVELCSKTALDDVGHKIVVEAGKVLEQEEIGCSKGTTITVKNLFFNTPVRYKFLKKDYTETGYIEDAISRLAIINTHISFKLINTGKTIIQTNGDGNVNNVIFSIYGKDIAKAVLPVNYVYEGVVITGVVGKPEIARSNRGNQLFFINRRYIKDKTLSSATEKAFKGLLPIGKYGFLVLNIEIAPSTVDVNVHPAKLEVRFQDENKIFKAVYNAVKDTLLKAELIENVEEKSASNTTKDNTYVDFTSQAFTNTFRKIVNSEQMIAKEDSSPQVATLIKEYDENLQIEEKSNNVFLNNNIDEEIKISSSKDMERTKKNQILAKLPMETLNDKESLEYSNNKSNIIQKTKSSEQEYIPEDYTYGAMIAETITNNLKRENVVTKEEDKKVNFEDMYSKIFGKIHKEEPGEEKTSVTNAKDIIDENVNMSLCEEEEKYTKKASIEQNYKLIGIAFQTYIIIEIEKELYIIDQHAAHERIMYEKVRKNYYSQGQKDSQLLLLPDIIVLSHKEMDIARDNMSKFKKAGFQLEEFGENTIKLTGVPTMCLDLNTKDLFLETLDEINTVARTAKQEIEERFLATIACKAAVKAHMALTQDEVDSLLQQLLSLTNPFTCPHGRPTAIKMSITDIEKKFARRK